VKITKQQLKYIIQKELDSLNENMFSDLDELDISDPQHNAVAHDVESGYAAPLKQIQKDIAEILNILRAGGGSY
jgi:ferritin-like protein